MFLEWREKRDLLMQKILAGIATIMLLLVVGSIIYDQVGKSDITAIVDLKDDQDPFYVLPTLVPRDGSIREVKEINRAKNEYEVTFRTRYRVGLLEWLLDHKSVENAEIK